VPQLSRFYDDSVDQINRRLRALCVARHPYLAEHFARFFADIGLDAKSAKGLDEATSLSREFKPDIVICEYELLAIFSVRALRRDAILSETPVIAVSLTRGAKEVPVANMEGVESFLYLPTLDPDVAAQAICAATNAGNEFRLPLPGGSRIDEVEAML
jgi:DNA-binding NarL/FixJ family response regulator